MFGLYDCIFSTAITFLELLQNLFTFCAELTKTGLVYALCCFDFFAKVCTRGNCLAIFGHSGVNWEITSPCCYLSLFITNYSSKQR